MEETHIPDYKLDEGFLKEVMFEKLKKPSAEDFTVKLPVSIQVIKTFKSTGGWNSYILADGEFQMSGCVFMSKQAKPQRYSILKIKKISKLPLNMRNIFSDLIPTHSLARVGEIEFETQVSGEEISFSLYQDLKAINMKELIKRQEEIGFTNLKNSFDPPKPVELTKQMWENRSEKFSDVKFTFEGDEDVVVYANKNVLVAASEVFRAHFDNEEFIDNKSVHIDSSPYSFKKLLEFIYMGKVQFTTWRMVFELLYLSKKYILCHLEDLCQRVIIQFCNYDNENLLKVFEQNKEVNDEVIQDEVESDVISRIYEVINSNYFLNCEFTTVEWMMSLYDLEIDEWSRLCAIYKWALHNGANAFCQKEVDQNDEPQNCLHALLEYVRYENIDGLDLQRFLKLPKLSEIINVSELKQSIFESLLENGFYLDEGTNFYSKFRNDTLFSAEIEIGHTKEMKNIHLSTDGPVIGFKIKQENLDDGENSLDLVFSFRYLYSKDEKKEAQLYVNIGTARINKGVQKRLERSFEITRDEWQEFRLHFKDYRGYLSDKIEDFGVNIESANNSKILSLLIDIELCSDPDSDVDSN